MLKTTPLHQWHLDNKAKMLGFSGYDMPIQYAGVMQEHATVREDVGLFDVAHMGLLLVDGEKSIEVLNQLITKDLNKLDDGRAVYTMFCNENGGILDDLIAYRASSSKVYLVLNAGNKDADLAHILSFDNQHQMRLTSLFDDVSILALQGPRSFALLNELGVIDLKANPEGHRPFDFISSEIRGISVQVAFTGYTGEKGCEIFVSNDQAEALWTLLLEAGQPHNIKPCGLAARDTLRLEMGYSLHGQDISPEISPIEAGLKWAVDFGKEAFLGKQALEAHVKQPPRKWIGLKNDSKQAPRTGMKIFDARDQEVGAITSGTYAPSLGHAIGMGLVNTDAVAPFCVEIRKNKIPFESTKRPFYKGQ